MVKLTRIESNALQAEFNLADAHVHYKPNPQQLELILARLPMLFDEASSTSQTSLDRRFIETYHALAGQQGAHEISASFLCYSASIAIEIVANVLAMSGATTVGLIEPTFDNIPDIMRRNGLVLRSVDVVQDALPNIVNAIHDDIDALFLVLPNNPTGLVLPPADLQTIAARCEERAITLVIDTSFRLFDYRACYDMYEILEASAVNYMVVEDTGKVWPSLDLKISILNTNEAFLSVIEEVVDDFLLNVSPFISRLLTEFCVLSQAAGLEDIRLPIARNRATLRTRLRSLPFFSIPFSDSRVSVELLQIPREYKASEIATYLRREYGVWCLPSAPFFWSGQRDEAERYLRLALARDETYFSNALDRFLSGLQSLLGREST